METTSRGTLQLLTIALGLAAGGSLLWAAADADSKPSSYAPAKELRSQIDYFLGRLSTDLADEKEYGVEQQGRVSKDACTIAALAMVLGKHDEENPVMGKAGPVVAGANQLAKKSSDYAEAKAELDRLKKVLADNGGVQAVQVIAWGPAGDLAELMKQVPVVNNSLRRNVTGRRFQQTAEASAGAATTLAALAQVSIYDTTYCEDEAGQKRWAEICVEMREAAAEVRAAIQKADQKGATAALDKLAKSCDVCHEEFRDK